MAPRRVMHPSKLPSVRKLRAEMTRTVAGFLRKQAPKITGQVIVLRSQLPVHKAELSQDELDALEQIVSGIDFTGWAVLVGEVDPLLQEIVKDSSYAAIAQVGLDVSANPGVDGIVNTGAVDYAAERSAEMVGMRRDELGRLVPNPNAEWQITEGTRDSIRAAVREAIEQGDSNHLLAEKISESYGFSEARAEVIARTETNRASNTGALNGYRASGVVDGKQWLTADDDLVSEECQENGVAGPNGDGVLFDLDADYPSGDVAPPVHPNCRCAIAPFIAFTNEPETAEQE